MVYGEGGQMMKRIIGINSAFTLGDFCEVSKFFSNEEKAVEKYPVVSEAHISNEKNYFSDSIVLNVITSDDELNIVREVCFRNCIFISELDLNLHDFEGKVIFENCVFLSDFTLFGRFYGYVSFEQSSFLGKKVCFDECLFDNFNFRLTTMVNTVVTFGQTEIRDNGPFFSEMMLIGSKVDYAGTSFEPASKTLNLLGVESDDESIIFFRLVDFDFREIRLFKAHIGRIEFLDCTFSCNRFEWECECKILVMQGCRNFRVINFTKLIGLSSLNIHGLTNTGRVILPDDIGYFIDALKSKESIYWDRSNKYGPVDIGKFKDQLLTVKELLSLAQSRQSDLVHQEIEVATREEQMRIEGGMSMRVFLSYSWNDEKLTDSIDMYFSQLGITLIRDKRDIHYRSSIKDYMKQIRFNDYVLIILSPDYIKSENCMYEIGELTKDDNYKSRLLPVITGNTSIFDPTGRNAYLEFWQEKYKKLYSESERLEPLNRSAIILELLRYENIMRSLPLFLKEISEMKMIVCSETINDEQFEEIRKVISV